jgi:hypothetical protein
MNAKVKSKLLDIFNSSFSENNNLNKSQNNITLDADILERKIKNSSSLPKFPQYNYVNRSLKKDKIKDILNKSLTELGFSNSRNTKSYFDNINTTTEKYFGGKKQIVVIHKEFDYDNFINKMDEKRKKNNNDIFNYNNEFNNNNIINKYSIRKNNNNNNNNTNINNNLRKKICAFVNELQIENPLKGKSIMNRPMTSFDNNYNNGNYSSPFYQGRINNLTRSNFSNVFNFNPSSSSNKFNYSLKRNNEKYSNDLFNQTIKSSKYSSNNFWKKYDDKDELINNFMKEYEKKKSGNNRKNSLNKINLNF